MLTVEGIFDGQQINLLEHVPFKKHIRVLITFLDERELETDAERKMIEQTPSVKGFLHKYANPALIEREKTAWQTAVRKKHASR